MKNKPIPLQHPELRFVDPLVHSRRMRVSSAALPILVDHTVRICCAVCMYNIHVNRMNGEV